MKITDSDKINHRKLQNEGDLQKVSAEQKEYAGYWRTAHSPILLRTLSNDRLKRAGYPNFYDYYLASNCVNSETVVYRTYVWWRGRSADQLMVSLLPDF